LPGHFYFLVTDLHTVTDELGLVILVYLLCRLRKSSIREASIERKAKAQEEVLQKKVKQLEDQLQEATHKHNKEQTDSEARRLKVCPILALL
jgi:ribosome-binding ATPase YchF (GTP1/OBG family)